MNESSEWDLILKMRKFDKRGGLGDRLFEKKKKKKKIITFFLYVYVCFVGNVAESVWLASVWLIIHTKQFFLYFFKLKLFLLYFLVVK